MKILFRVDADARIGSGHAMRCLALAQANHRDGGKSFFLSSSFSKGMTDRFRGEACMLLPALGCSPYGEEDARETARQAKEIGAGWIVVDGYNFDARYQECLKEEGTRVLFVDDYGHCDHYAADLVLNQNISAREGLYANRDGSTRLLLGTRFVLLRQEFLSGAYRERTIVPEARNVLVTLGGGDPDNVTGKVLKALDSLTGIRVTVVIGGSNPHHAEIETLAHAMNAVVRMNATNMPRLMADADMAITAAGTTGYELAFMGLPSLSIVIADNQRKIAEEMERQGVSRSLGWHADLTEGRIAQAVEALRRDKGSRATMSDNGHALVDGKGAKRILDASATNA
jgi:UDP-2,4-diacetamido-2,4,6-trideoxy-beta-L-altropyranose hydrolase